MKDEMFGTGFDERAGVEINILGQVWKRGEASGSKLGVHPIRLECTHGARVSEHARSLRENATAENFSNVSIVIAFRLGVPHSTL